MSHLTSPNSFRSGKTFLWSNVGFANSSNTQGILNKETVLPKGLESIVRRILLRRYLLLISLSVRKDSVTGLLKGKILYYPMLSILPRKRSFPTYLLHMPLASVIKNYKRNTLEPVLKKIWALKRSEFNDRFISSKRRTNLNRWLSSGIFRGSKIFKRRNIYVSRRLSQKCRKWGYSKSRSRLFWWRHSKSRGLYGANISRWLKLRTGLRVLFTTQNIFNYLAKKDTTFSFKKYQTYVWNPRYKSYHREISSYFDIVNIFYLLCKFSGQEKLLMQLIQRGLVKMHRRRIKPKRFFIFLDKIIKNLPVIRDVFNGFRIIITGKLAGGTARTKSFSVGFGVFPRQTLSENIKFLFGDVRSKYGSFGIKILTWRKTNLSYFPKP